MNCRGDDGIDAKRSRPSIANPRYKCHARLERVLLVGTRSADYIRASGHSGRIQRPYSDILAVSCPRYGRLAGRVGQKLARPQVSQIAENPDFLRTLRLVEPGGIEPPTSSLRTGMR